MKISIITVCYNSAQTLAETIRSVAAQAGAELEHIVIDGGSTDSTPDIIAAHANRLAHVVREPDAGIYDAMNKGLRLATGEFVGFLNADDVFADCDVVARIVAAALPSVDAVYGDLAYVDKERTGRIVRYWSSGPFQHASLRHGWMPPHPTFYVRRSLVTALGGFDLGFRIAADYDFMLRYLGRPGARVAYVPALLVRMRVGGASNRSFSALVRKSREDLQALRKNRVGGLGALLLKNVRKLPQFVLRPTTAHALGS